MGREEYEEIQFAKTFKQGYRLITYVSVSQYENANEIQIDLYS